MRSDAEARKLFDAHVDMAERVASAFVRVVRFAVERNELRAFALGGLWDAARRFKQLEDGPRFDQYAGIRIRGAIRDGLRSTEWFQRRNFRTSDGMPISQAPASRIDEVFDTAPTQEQQLEAAQLRARLRLAIEKLPKRERDIVVRHCFADVKLAQIGREQGLTEQRISQIKHQALEHLRELLNGDTSFLERG